MQCLYNSHCTDINRIYKSTLIFLKYTYILSIVIYLFLIHLNLFFIVGRAVAI